MIAIGQDPRSSTILLSVAGNTYLELPLTFTLEEETVLALTVIEEDELLITIEEQ